MSTWLVRKKKDNMHQIVKTINDTDLKSNYTAAPRELNSLLVAKTQKQIIRVLSKIPPLIPARKFVGEQRIYSTQAKDIKKFTKAFTSCDLDQLQAEFFLDSAKGVRANSDSLQSFINNYGSDGQSIIDEIDLSEHTLLSVEPLLDVTTMRNTLTVVARLLGHLREDINHQNIFADCGFAHRHSKYWGMDIYYIPFKFDITKDVNRLHPQWYTKGNDVVDPLFCALNRSVKRKVKMPYFGEHEIDVRQPTPNDNDVFFANYATTTEDFEKIFGFNKITNPKKRIFLCVRDTGKVEEMAQKAVTVLVNSYQNLKDTSLENGGEFGWRNDEYSFFESCDHPRIVAGSYASALIYSLLYHPKYRLAICEFCGNASLTNERGMRREYCSDSCRVRAVQQRRKEALK